MANQPTNETIMASSTTISACDDNNVKMKQQQKEADKEHHLSGEEQLRRSRRKDSYHLVASKNKLPKDLDETDEEEDILFQHLTKISSSSSQRRRSSKDLDLQRSLKLRDDIQQAKKRLFRDIAKSGGDTTTQEFHDTLDTLLKLYDPTQFDARKILKKTKTTTLEGMWITLSKPNFIGCLGQNSNDEYMYTLGRMSFGKIIV